MAAERQESLIADLLDGDLQVPELSERETALLRYADRLTRDPASVTEQHIAELRDSGLDDRGIHDACVVVSYFAFVNRIADGLGVELEP